MFSNPMTIPWQFVWPGVLFVAWAVLLFGGLLGKPQAGRAGRMPRWMRMASSATLVVAGWSGWLIARDTPAATSALLIAVGMTFGFLGDLFMARLLPVKGHVLWGMATFGLGHLAYIAAATIFGNQLNLAAGVRWVAWGVWLLIAVIGWYRMILRGQRFTALRWAALPYALLLASTAGVATGLAVQEPRLWPMCLGAALFLFSDLILAAQLFNHLVFRRIDDVVWLTYGPGQMLIVASIWAALRVVLR